MTSRKYRISNYSHGLKASLTLTGLSIVLSGLVILETPIPSDAKSWGRDYFPNVPLITHEGKTVRFYDDLIKDKKVLINFIYVNCEQACPLATAKMAHVQKRLGARIGRDIFIYSITLEPERDTAEVLNKYAEQFGAGPGWLFLTGKREHIDKVRYKLGERDDAKEDHNNLIRIGNGAKGNWMRLPLFGDLTYIVNEIGKTLDPNWYSGRTVKSFTEASATVTEGPVIGRTLFRNKCSACHTIGQGNGIGPDLQGVTTRRDRLWLARFISDPDLMRAGKDPLALDLTAKYTKTLMPNLGLTKTEVLDLISYLDAEVHRHEPPQGKGLHGTHQEKKARPMDEGGEVR